MKMETYPTRNHMISQPNPEAPVPHFAWMNPGNFLSATKKGLNHLQPTQSNPHIGLAAVPICSISPIIVVEGHCDIMTKPAKLKKQKFSNKTVSKNLRPKQPKKSSVSMKGQNMPAVKREKRNLNIDADVTNLDFSWVPSPVCSCTGVSRGCYKWGAGGWQSSCCTTNISEYPLPINASRPGARMAGRKMSIGAYGKLLHRLAAEGHDLSHAVDLKNHWARHGTNKFVTIR